MADAELLEKYGGFVNPFEGLSFATFLAVTMEVHIVDILKPNLEIISKHKHVHFKKKYSTLRDWPTCVCSYGKFSFQLGVIPAKSSDIPPTTMLMIY